MRRHDRQPDLRPRDGLWHMRCACGWAAGIDFAGLRRDELEERLEQAFRDHLPEPERITGLRVDQRPGQECVHLVPLGQLADLQGWHESEGIYYGRTACGRVLPVVEIWTDQGRTIKME